MLINSLPFGLAELVMVFLTKKVTMCYSSFPGPRTGYNFGGTVLRDCVGFAPAIGTASSGIMALSLGNVMKLGLISDLNNIENP